MDNKIKKQVIYILANCQKIALSEYIKTLPPQDRADVVKLLKALNITLN